MVELAAKMSGDGEGGGGRARCARAHSCGTRWEEGAAGDVDLAHAVAAAAAGLADIKSQARAAGAGR